MDVFWVGVACARLSDSIRSGNVLKAKLRRARLGKGGGGGGKNGRESLLAFFLTTLFRPFLSPLDLAVKTVNTPFRYNHSQVPRASISRDVRNILLVR